MTAQRGAAGAIRTVEVATRRSRRDFLDLPAAVYADDPNWIAPLRMIERKRMSTSRHPFYDHGEGCFWVAYRDGRPVGRIGALINRLHLEQHGDATGHFAMFEAVDDAAVIAALFGRAEAWLRERGMKRAAGPFNLSINEETGLLIEGFHRPPMVGMGHGRPYYKDRLAALGYRKEVDLLAFYRDIGTSALEGMVYEFDRTMEKAGITIRTSDRRRFDADVRRLLQLFNDAWAGNWGFVPITEREIRSLVKDMKVVLDPRGILVAELRGEILAMMVAIKNLNEALEGLGGRLFPLGWVRLLWRLKVRGVKTGRIPLAGNRRKLHALPAAAKLPMVFLLRLRDIARDEGYTHVEGSWVLEDNEQIIKFARLGGFEVDKRYRVFSKAL